MHAAFGLDRFETYEAFANKVYEIKKTLSDYVSRIVDDRP